MAADPKYAGLPGIAVDQPDMYETNDSEEREENDETSSSTEESEILHLSSLSWLGDIEIGTNPDSNETIVQKFTRLRCEVGELLEELDAMAESERQEGRMEGLNLQVKDLTRQLEKCQVDNDEKSSVACKGISVENLTKQIHDMQQQQGKPSETSEGVYELLIQPNEKGSLDISTVDGRLAALEKIIGNSSVADRKVLSAQTDGSSISKSMDVLSSRKGFLQQQHVDHVEGRLAALTYKMNAIGEQKAAVEAANKEDKVTKLADMVSSQASVACVLPDLVSRMETVCEVQERAKEWSSIVDSTEQQQQETKKLLEDAENMVKETRQTFDTQLSTVADKFAELQKKLELVHVK